MSKLTFFDTNFKTHKTFNSAKTKFTQINFQSDIQGLAEVTNSNVVNSWGVVYDSDSKTDVLSVVNNGTGTFIQLNAETGETIGNPINILAGQPESGSGSPTGLISINAKSNYFGDASFLTVTEDGTIQRYNPTSDTTQFFIAVNNSSNSVYKGLALKGNILYVANFHSGFIETYGPDFSLTSTFTDPALTTIGYAPFNLNIINKLLYVNFAKQDDAKHDDVSGLGNGFVDVFDLKGNLINRLINRGALNSPWTIIKYQDNLLISNFGDGKLNIYGFDGTFIGPLLDKYNNPISIDSLWGVSGGSKGSKDLYFTAGINSEADGLIGKLDL